MAPALAFSKAAIAALNPASSESVPQVVKERVSLPEAAGSLVEGAKPHPARRAGSVSAPAAVRK